MIRRYQSWDLACGVKEEMDADLLAVLGTLHNE